jgi:MFS transporter, UMF1 family
MKAALQAGARRESRNPGAARAAPIHARRGAVTAWILYDVAMHGYTLMIPGVAYAIYFTSYVAVDGGRADLLWALAVGLSLIIAGVLAPWIGAAADTSGRRRSLLAVATLVCGLATALLFTVGRGEVFVGIALFVLAQVGATIGASIYNSFLPLVATRQGASRLSGLAWGLSYIGGIACFLLCLPFTRGGITDANAANFINTFLVTAAFLLVIGLPSAAALPVASPARSAGSIAGPYRRIWATIRQWRTEREVPKFLLAYYLVNDAVVTVIFFTAVMMKKTFGLEVQEVLMLSLVLQAIAIPSTMFFGWLGGRWSQRGAIYITLALWMLTLGLMAVAQGRPGALMIALSLGLVLGSTQSLFRSLFVAMVPLDRASEYFGFHSLAGRASAALGPLFFGIVSAATGSQRWAMASLAVFFVAGGVVLATVRIPATVASDALPQS